MRTLFALAATFVLPLFVCLADETPITGTDMDLEFAGADVGFLPTDGDALAGTFHPDGGVVLLGGDSADGALAGVHRINRYSGEVTAMPALPEPRSGAAAGTLDGRVYAIGGRNGDKTLSRVDVLEPEAERWTPGPALPNPLVGAACISGFDGLLVIGGHDGKKARNEILKLEKDRRDRWVWTVIARIKTARANHAAVKLPDGRIMVIGGRSDDGPLDTCETIDGKKVAPGPALPAPMDDLVAGTIFYPGEELVVMPGLKGKDVQTPLRLNLALNRWEPRPSWPGLAVRGAVGVSSGGQLLTAGGRNLQGARVAGIRSFGWNAAWKKRVSIRHDGERSMDFRDLRIAPDGKTFATTCAARRVEIRDMETGEVLRSVEVSDAGRNLAWSPDGKKLLVVTNSFTEVHILDVATMKLMNFGKRSTGYRLGAWSPDGKLVAITDLKANAVFLHDAATGAHLHDLVGHGSAMSGVAFSPDSKRVISSAKDGTIRIWDAAQGKHLQTIEIGIKVIHSLAVSPDGKRAVVGDYDGKVAFVDLEAGATYAIRHLHRGGVLALGFDPTGRFVASGAHDEGAEAGFGFVVWSVATAEDVQRLAAANQGHFAKFARFHPTRPTLYLEGPLSLEIVDFVPASAAKED